ncbi:putative DNA primase large subunit [Morella rubra]|uniref:Putative DNA primase large subunit n=1 Tax=Morella rubra TaxID=262757 RepID=A0A6A1V6E1_9ROSI|nr:putative DNA primase large subunit [Morella rubra]
MVCREEYNNSSVFMSPQCPSHFSCHDLVQRVLVIYLTVKYLAVTYPMRFIAHNGIVGSVLAKEGRMSTVSDFVSGALKIVLKQIRQDDSSPAVNKPRNDSLFSVLPIFRVMKRVLVIYVTVKYLAVTYPMRFIAHNGIVGSVLAKEGRMSTVSDFVSGALKIVLKQIRQDDSSPAVNKPRNDSLMAQVSNIWKATMRHPEASEIVNKDIISHFVLRLVYCRTEELRKWFISMETALFQYRCRLESAEAQVGSAYYAALSSPFLSDSDPLLELQRSLMSEFDLPYKAVSHAEFQIAISSLVHYFYLALFMLSPTPMKVPFEEVPELVAGRKVFVHRGHAYVAMNQVVSLVSAQFRSHLSKALVLTNRKWTSIIREQEKDRLTPIVEALCTSYLGPDYSELREDHHLKHGGRMQLGLFLKVIFQS